MFTRIVEIRCNRGKNKELCRIIEEKALPILRTQPGFRDQITLVSTGNPDHVLATSYWDTREDAERYHRQEFPGIFEMLKSVSEGEPRVHTYDVEISTAHRIALEKAA